MIINDTKHSSAIDLPVPILFLATSFLISPGVPGTVVIPAPGRCTFPDLCSIDHGDSSRFKSQICKNLFPKPIFIWKIMENQLTRPQCGL